MTLLNLQGQALAKRTHDPERTQRRRAELSQILANCKHGWVADVQADPQGATLPDIEAISAYWVGKWEEQAKAANQANDPINVQVDAMQRFVDAELKKKERMEQMATSLAKLPDLEPLGFALVGVYEGAPLWISSEAVVLQHDMVKVWLRDFDSSIETWLGALWLDRREHSRPDVALPHYTAGELLDLLGALRRQRPVRPLEHELEAARQYLGIQAPTQP